MTDPIAADVVVVGAGPAGLTAAVALAGAGVETVLVGGTVPNDNRTTALVFGSLVRLSGAGRRADDAAHH
jgi:2-octaprenyl-6-methoxyphenol hydroxylase